MPSDWPISRARKRTKSNINPQKRLRNQKNILKKKSPASQRLIKKRPIR